METKVIQRTIDSFLKQRIDKEIESEQKKQKDAFTDEHRQKIESKYEVFGWLNYIAEKSGEVSLNVSHVAKLTHSSSKANNVIDTLPQTKHLHLITTQTTESTNLDSGYTNAIYSPVADFLSYPVENSNKSLGQFLAEDEQFFCHITDCQETRSQWQEQIAQAYVAKKVSSHVLAKQVYFPVSNDNYHLISPVKSSALAHKIHEKISLSRSKEHNVNQAKRNNQWHDDTHIYYPKVAFLSVTKSNHQNASKLNGLRRGGMYLFQSVPPEWKKQPRPPVNIEQFLAICFNLQSKAIFRDIKRLLYIIKSRGLSLNLERKRILIESISAICDEIFNQILMIQQSNNMGWSRQHNIEGYLTLFLDPYRDEEQAITKSEQKQYIEEFVQHVTEWVSLNLGDKKRTTASERLWFKIMLPLFNEFYAVITAE